MGVWGVVGVVGGRWDRFSSQWLDVRVLVSTEVSSLLFIDIETVYSQKVRLAFVPRFMCASCSSMNLPVLTAS